ncbi:hypothetical protein TNCT_3991 [Trichonephila clavata]|uniref:Uncharacterized protein n=1 Tax=Trichonephila clavata TaxID=2740835 RepID=A0A8X6HJI5_TRICU|nr:hypothetical protein TNCT_3991 [Trichonephila clavata]
MSNLGGTKFSPTRCQDNVEGLWLNRPVFNNPQGPWFQNFSNSVHWPVNVVPWWNELFIKLRPRLCRRIGVGLFRVYLNRRWVLSELF